MKAKKIITSSVIALTLLGSSAPLFVGASSLTPNNVSAQKSQTVYVSDKQIIDYIRENNPELYNMIPKDEAKMMESGIIQVAVRGVNKITTNKNGFRVYLNSYWADKVKTGGKYVVIGLFAAVGYTAGNIVGVVLSTVAGAYISDNIGKLNTSRGVWFGFSYLGVNQGNGRQ